LWRASLVTYLKSTFIHAGLARPREIRAPRAWRELFQFARFGAIYLFIGAQTAAIKAIIAWP
jgi:hypothetical protein